MAKSIKERVASYMEASNYKLLDKLLTIVLINGRNFNKITNLLDKPFDSKFAECMCSALIKLMQESDGAIFGYTFSDEIILVLKNDQTPDTLPYYDNYLQKINSVTSSIATLQFNNYVNSKDLNLMGDAVFSSQIFNIPNIDETINFLCFKQQQAIQSSIYFACFYELLKKYNKNEIKEMLIDRSTDDKINLLQQECKINYSDYLSAFRRGVAAYRTEKNIYFDGKEIIKNKLFLDVNLPIFTKEHFLQNILK